jgi:hypothetical protein
MGGRKLKLSKTVILLGMILTTSGGCGMLTESTETPVSPIQQESPTLSANNATPATTATPTHTRIPTSPPARTRIPTSTMPFIPTLPAEEARIRLIDLLADNGGCRLPCLWGIALNESNLQETQNILVPLSSISDLSEFRQKLGAIHPGYSEKDLLINTTVDVSTFPDNDLVNRILFIAEAFTEVPDPIVPDSFYPAYVYDSNYFGSKLAYYSLPHILSEYGRPSTVLLKTYPGPNWLGQFKLILLYPDQGFLIQYTTKGRMSGSNVLGCPANAHVTLDLYPSGHAETFYELIGPGWNDVLPLFKPLEEVTSLSLDQFYQTFRQPTDKCLVTASTNWPTPER